MYIAAATMGAVPRMITPAEAFPEQLVRLPGDAYAVAEQADEEARRRRSFWRRPEVLVVLANVAQRIQHLVVRDV